VRPTIRVTRGTAYLVISCYEEVREAGNEAGDDQGINFSSFSRNQIEVDASWQ
jgi:hypothetical protein